MPYVMVPVPEELEAEVGQFILKLSLTAALSKWDAAAVQRLLVESSPRARSVVVAMAQGNVEKTTVSDRTVGEALGIGPNEVVEAAMEVNETCRQNGFPALLLMKSDKEDDGDGGERLLRRFLIGAEAARLVLAEQREPEHDAGA
jgi:hypothetical protein